MSRLPSGLYARPWMWVSVTPPWAAAPALATNAKRSRTRLLNLRSILCQDLARPLHHLGVHLQLQLLVARRQLRHGVPSARGHHPLALLHHVHHSTTAHHASALRAFGGILVRVLLLRDGDATADDHASRRQDEQQFLDAHTNLLGEKSKLHAAHRGRGLLQPLELRQQ